MEEKNQKMLEGFKRVAELIKDIKENDIAPIKAATLKNSELYSKIEALESTIGGLKEQISGVSGEMQNVNQRIITISDAQGALGVGSNIQEQTYQTATPPDGMVLPAQPVTE